jgi:hypothetical protein
MTPEQIKSLFTGEIAIVYCPTSELSNKFKKTK